MSKTLPTPPQPPLRQEFVEPYNDRTAREYVRDLIKYHAAVPTLSLLPGGEDRSQRVEDLFVDPCASPQRLSPEAMDDLQQAVLRGDGHAKLPEPLLPQLAAAQRAVVLGDPGSGKSTLVQWLTSILAAPPSRPLPLEFARLIPVPLILRDLQLPADPAHITWDSILHAFLLKPVAVHLRQPGSQIPAPENSPPAAHPDLLPRWLASGQAFVMLDGLDEVASPIRRLAIRRALWEGMGQYPRCRWLCTSRVVGYEEAPVDFLWKTGAHGGQGLSEANPEKPNRRGIPPSSHGLCPEPPERPDTTHPLLAPEELLSCPDAGTGPSQRHEGEPGKYQVCSLLYLAPFCDAQVRAFLHHWLLPRRGEAETRQRAAELCTRFTEVPAVRTISRLPNLLVFTVQLYLHTGILPNGRTLLYDGITAAYSNSIPRLGGLDVDYSQGEKQSWLARIGWELQWKRSAAEDAVEIEKNAARNQPADSKALPEITATFEELKQWLRLELEPSASADGGESALQAFLQFVTRVSGLLQPRGEGQYGFSHLSFQEYYAALHAETLFHKAIASASRRSRLSSSPDPWAHFREALAPALARSAWHEVFVFLAERLSSRSGLSYPLILLEQLCPELLQDQPEPVREDPEKNPDPVPWPAARLAARLSSNPFLDLTEEERASLWHRLWQWQQWRHAEGSAFVNAEQSLAPLMLSHAPSQGKVLAQLPHGIQRLSLDSCTGLVSVNSLPPSLSSLDLSGCTGLVSIDSLPPSLASLYLSGCTGLVSVDSLPPLLSRLYLSGCTGLVSVDSLPFSLSSLHLSGCTGLVSVDSLPPSLSRLYLRGCTGLVSVDSLPPLLSSLDLSDCTGLVSVDSLPPSLKELYLRGCTGLVSVDSLPPSLSRLYLRGCTGLVSVDSLPLSLTSLSLSGCTGLVSVDSLPPSLSSLDLSGCTGLVSVDSLPPSLTSLDLSGCTGLVSVDSLPPLLSRLYLRGCTGLVSVDSLPSSLTELNLSDCTGLASVDSLPRSLSSLDLIGCTGLSSEAVKRAMRRVEERRRR